MTDFGKAYLWFGAVILLLGALTGCSAGDAIWGRVAAEGNAACYNGSAPPVASVIGYANARLQTNGARWQLEGKATCD